MQLEIRLECGCSPGKVFKTEVVEARRRKETLDTKLADLKTRSQTAGEEVINISIHYKKIWRLLLNT